MQMINTAILFSLALQLLDCDSLQFPLNDKKYEHSRDIAVSSQVTTIGNSLKFYWKIHLSFKYYISPLLHLYPTRGKDDRRDMSTEEKLRKADTTLEMYLYWDMRTHSLFFVLTYFI